MNLAYRKYAFVMEISIRIIRTQFKCICGPMTKVLVDFGILKGTRRKVQARPNEM